MIKHTVMGQLIYLVNYGDSCVYRKITLIKQIINNQRYIEVQFNTLKPFKIYQKEQLRTHA